MSTIPIYISGVICVLLVIIWFQSKSFQKSIEYTSSLQSFLAIILALTVFIQLFYSVRVFKLQNDIDQKSQEAIFNSKMAALGSEIIANVRICEIILENKELYENAEKVPNNIFVYNTIQDALNSGLITHHVLRNKLISVLHRMTVANRTINNSINLFYNQTLVDNYKTAKINKRIILDMDSLIIEVNHIYQIYKEIVTLFEEYWLNYEKYIETDYVKGLNKQLEK